MAGNFVKRCECGTLVKLPDLHAVRECSNCGIPTSVKAKDRDSGSNVDQEPGISIFPVVD